MADPLGCLRQRTIWRSAVSAFFLLALDLTGTSSGLWQLLRQAIRNCVKGYACRPPLPPGEGRCEGNPPETRQLPVGAGDNEQGFMGVAGHFALPLHPRLREEVGRGEGNPRLTKEMAEYSPSHLPLPPTLSRRERGFLALDHSHPERLRSGWSHFRRQWSKIVDAGLGWRCFPGSRLVAGRHGTCGADHLCPSLARLVPLPPSGVRGSGGASPRGIVDSPAGDEAGGRRADIARFGGAGRLWRAAAGVGVAAGFWGAIDRGQQEAILVHELAHLAAGDVIWVLLADLLAAMLWWQPLVWWLRRRLRAAGEVAADEASLLVPDGTNILAACLVALGGPLGWLVARDGLAGCRWPAVDSARAWVVGSNDSWTWTSYGPPCPGRGLVRTVKAILVSGVDYRGGYLYRLGTVPGYFE